MQKRNQILASSNNRDQVEWLEGPSDKSRGKQPMLHSPALPRVAGSEYNGGLSPLGPAFAAGGHPSPGMGLAPPSALSSAWQPRSGDRSKPRAGDEHSVNSFEDLPDPRRVSLQSFATGDSDPGPGRPHMNPRPSYLHRQSSASSLSSAPSLVDASGRRYIGSLEAARQAHDNRSLSSLEFQLENLTAAERRQRTPGNVSPGPSHLAGSRPSASRQSHGSRTGSAHRQGSASPLHHSSLPRFHPYGTASSVGYSSQLPPLSSIAASGAGSVAASDYTGGAGGAPPTPGRPRSKSRTTAARGMSRGSAHSNTDGPMSAFASPAPHLAPLHSVSGGGINPMFHVPKPAGAAAMSPSGAAGGAAGQQQQQVMLPPFAELVASATEQPGASANGFMGYGRGAGEHH
jgi:meiosis induction protein kinase IME2/SME1